MTLIRDIFERLALLDRKTKVYQVVRTHLCLLIDQAHPNRDLPPGTDSTDALRVVHEMDAIIEAIETERAAYLKIEINAVEIPEADALVFPFSTDDIAQG